MNEWPPSNYPFLIALMLFAATAATLALGDAKLAEELAIYAYYLLVIGVAIRFFELSAPEKDLHKPGLARKRNSDYAKRLIPKSIGLYDIGRLFHSRIPGLYWALIETKIRISRYIKLHASNSKYMDIKNNIYMISDISRNIAIFLSVFFLISLIYGLLIDWWFVKGFLSKLILIIIGFSVFHIITKRRF